MAVIFTQVLVKLWLDLGMPYKMLFIDENYIQLLDERLVDRVSVSLVSGS